MPEPARTASRSARRAPRRRDAEGSRKLILQAALEEFSAHGHAGARVDRIAQKAGVSKPLIYDYFGDKDAIYAAALREAYVQIREGEAALELERMEPKEAIRQLVAFTMDHYRSKPWFVAMLNTENLRGGATIRSIKGADEIQSVLVTKLGEVLRKGVARGEFRAGIDPIDLYIFIASICYFPISNIHTLRAVFHCPIDDAWLDARVAQATRMILGYLAPDSDGATV